MDFALANTHKLANLLSEVSHCRRTEISYDQFINRGSFWMATGSGKTLVLVEPIEVLGVNFSERKFLSTDILI